MKSRWLFRFVTLCLILVLSACNIPTDNVLPRPPTPTANPITDSVIPQPLGIRIFPSRDVVFFGVCAVEQTRLSVNVRLTGLTADVNSVEMSWRFSIADGSAPDATGGGWEQMYADPSLGPNEYVASDIMINELALNRGISSNTSHTITIYVRALDAAGNELEQTSRTIAFEPCPPPEGFTTGIPFLHGVLYPNTVWQCNDGTDISVVYINAELFDPESQVVRVIATNRLVSAAGASSGSVTEVELTPGPATPAGGIYYSGSLDTSEFDTSRLTDFDYGLQITLQAHDASGRPVLEAGPYVIRYRKDCITDPSSGIGKPDTPASGEPINFVLTKNAVCRGGPSMGYEIKEYIAVGDTVPAEARSEDSAWLVVTLPNGVRCWVSILLGTPQGDPNGLPVEEAPPLAIPPTPGSDNSGSDDNQSGGNQGGGTPVDADGDGYTSDVDCDDSSAKIYPGAYDDPNESTDANCDGAP